MINVKRNIAVLLILLLGIVFFVFFPCLKNGFVNWDDHDYITNNNLIRELSLKNIIRIFTFFSFHGHYHPLTLVSFSLDYQLFGLKPGGYHAVNLVIHALNVFLVFWLIFLVSGNEYTAFGVSLLFSIHPLQVESVAWVTERKNLLYAFFYLGALISYMYYTRKHQVGYYIPCIVMFLFSLLSKGLAVSLPLVLILFDYLLNKKITKRNLLDKIPFVLLSGVFAVIAILAQYQFDAQDKTPLLKPVQNMFVMFYSLAFYLYKIALPFKLSCIYPYPGNMESALPLIYYVSPVIIFILLTGLYYSRKYTRIVIFGGLFFVVTLLPIVQVRPLSPAVAADRYVYIPCIGIFYIVVELVRFVLKKKGSNVKFKIIILSLCFLIAGDFSYTSWSRCFVWKDSFSLWDDVIGKYPDNVMAWTNRGMDRYDKGDYKKAILDLSFALEIDPDSEKALVNRGNALLSLNQYEKALNDFNRVLEVNPASFLALLNRSKCFEVIGDKERAVQDLKNAINLNPQSWRAFYNLGTIYLHSGNNESAEKVFSQSIKLNPYNKRAFTNRGLSLAGMGQFNKAVLDYNKALELDSTSYEIYFNRGISWENLGEWGKANADYTKALELKPNLATGYYKRSRVLFHLRQYQKAKEDAQTASSLGFKLDPNYLKELEEKILR